MPSYGAVLWRHDLKSSHLYSRFFVYKLDFYVGTYWQYDRSELPLLCPLKTRFNSVPVNLILFTIVMAAMLTKRNHRDISPENEVSAAELW